MSVYSFSVAILMERLVATGGDFGAGNFDLFAWLCVVVKKCCNTVTFAQKVAIFRA